MSEPPESPYEAENHRDLEYYVEITGTRYNRPDICTCCLKKTDIRRPVRAYGKNNTSISTRMPLCADCLKHARQFTWLAVLLAAAAYIAGTLAAGFGLRLITEGPVPVLLNALIRFAAASGIFLLLSALIRMKELPQHHAARFDSVALSGMLPENGEARMKFAFRNRASAQVFWEGNRSIARPVTSAAKFNTAKRASVLRLMLCRPAMLWITGGVYVLLSLLAANV
ncbi:MAG: hypothetical protein CW338_06380 [Clostridiales bacterium]|nr:hypothetical protein [Clostridiales bacterium]